VSILRTDPTLKAKVETWIDYGGNEKSLSQLPDAVNTLPIIRLIPELDSWSRAAVLNSTGVADSPIDITIEIAVAGFNWDDSANMWDAIHRRIYSQNAPERAHVDSTLAEAGVMDVIVLKPATTINDTGSPFAVATGKFRLEMYIPE
jgi:hypothetical protein